jgi:hypothetical protein
MSPRPCAAPSLTCSTTRHPAPSAAQAAECDRPSPDALASVVAKRMRAAYRNPDPLIAQAELEALARELNRSHPGAAAWPEVLARIDAEQGHRPPWPRRRRRPTSSAALGRHRAGVYHGGVRLRDLQRPLRLHARPRAAGPPSHGGLCLQPGGPHPRVAGRRRPPQQHPVPARADRPDPQGPAALCPLGGLAGAGELVHLSTIHLWAAT